MISFPLQVDRLDVTSQSNTGLQLYIQQAKQMTYTRSFRKLVFIFKDFHRDIFASVMVT